MRTTLTLDEDVLDRAREIARRLSQPFKVVINRALRLGLEDVEKPARSRRYRTTPRKMGLRRGIDLDNIGELLAGIENEDRR